MTKVIPNFASSFLASVENSNDITTLNVPKLLHRAGINLRYIGDVIHSLKPFVNGDYPKPGLFFDS
jgi:hypothetical protein